MASSEGAGKKSSSMRTEDDDDQLLPPLLGFSDDDDDKDDGSKIDSASARAGKPAGGTTGRSPERIQHRTPPRHRAAIASDRSDRKAFDPLNDDDEDGPRDARHGSSSGSSSPVSQAGSTSSEERAGMEADDVAALGTGFASPLAGIRTREGRA